MSSSRSATFLSTAGYGRFLLFIAGMGGLLYGIDVGIISAALLYLGKAVKLGLQQQSIVAAAVFGGSMFGSLVAGYFADRLGRRTMMMVSGFLFVASVIIIVLSNGFGPLFAGRLLQGVSGGVIAVVVPLYLAECLSADNRGKGSGIFQFMLTVGIVIAVGIGWYFTRQAEAAITAAAGNSMLILAAENHAWRSMFLSVVVPGTVFFAGCFLLSESPRWLFRRGRRQEAMAALLRASGVEQAEVQFHEMENTATTDHAIGVAQSSGSLLQRKYVVPFLLACVILICNQTTGINSILTYLAVILKQAGMNSKDATQWDFWVTLVNCVMTFVAVTLVDRKGRKFLLMLGTSGIVVALSTGAFLFYRLEVLRLAPTEHSGLLVAVCLALFIASFAVGPGVVVWLTLSELMPTRIRSNGMGIALVLNQAASTLIAGVFLPVVGRFGYHAMFLFWVICTLVYFITAAFFLPETKGKTLEEIELLFTAPAKS